MPLNILYLGVSFGPKLLNRSIIKRHIHVVVHREDPVDDPLHCVIHWRFHHCCFGTLDSDFLCIRNGFILDVTWRDFYGNSEQK